MVKWLRRRPLTAESGVRVPLGVPNQHTYSSVRFLSQVYRFYEPMLFKHTRTPFGLSRPSTPKVSPALAKNLPLATFLNASRPLGVPKLAHFFKCAFFVPRGLQILSA